VLHFILSSKGGSCFTIPHSGKAANVTSKEQKLISAELIKIRLYYF